MTLNQFGQNAENYWSIDCPGLTKGQVDWLVAVINDRWSDTHAIAIDPRVFLAINIDYDTARGLKSALESAPTTAVTEGFEEILDEWLRWIERDG